MSGNPQPDAAAMQNLFQAGQAFAQGFMNFMLQQQGTQAGQAAPAPQFPQNEAIAGLQKEFAARHVALWQDMLQRGQGGAAAEVKDKRFSAPEWSESPYFDYLRQAYLVNADFLDKLIEAVPVDDAAARDRLKFFTRQFIDAMAPSNFVATNPEFISTALQTQGASITAGIRNLVADLGKGRISMTDDDDFEVGRNLAVTPGQVIFENELIQLIQYAPATPQVHARPLLIVPPCINKFYILDLQPENSFVRHAVAQGMTVFLVSWRNPQADLGHLGWDDYVEKGALQALDVAREVSGADKVNALGFCVGGTILSATLSVAKARGEERVASLTLLTALLDFADAGEIGCLVDESSVAMREATIGQGGLLRGAELAAVFSALRANDLIWQYVVGNYLKGQTPPAFDLLYWNADATNLPGPFLAWYLRNLYLENRLKEKGALAMCGERCDLSRIDVPTFIYASREDHIVPWMSGYASRALLGGKTRFVLGASGHIAGVINPPAKGKRSHWVNYKPAATATQWLEGATELPGSWWPRWYEWLDAFRGGERAARKVGSRTHPGGEAAPGRYVKERA